MGVLAIIFHLLGRRMQRRKKYTAGSINRSKWGFRLALLGSLSALTLWVLWGTGVLL